MTLPLSPHGCTCASHAAAGCVATRGPPQREAGLAGAAGGRGSRGRASASAARAGEARRRRRRRMRLWRRIRAGEAERSGAARGPAADADWEGGRAPRAAGTAAPAAAGPGEHRGGGEPLPTASPRRPQHPSPARAVAWPGPSGSPRLGGGEGWGAERAPTSQPSAASAPCVGLAPGALSFPGLLLGNGD